MNRLRPRLSYANVVATLSLFVALGGTGYAASQITSKEIKNRTIKGGDIRKDALTGTEVNEGRLREVPSARNALQASNASVADLSRNAENASALGGQGPGTFEKSSRTSFASAPLSPANAGDERTLISWPEMGAEVRTSSVPCGGNQVALRVRKTGGPYTSIFDGGTEKGTLVAGQDVAFCSNAARIWDGALANESGLTLFFECLAVNNAELRCIGTRSQP